jgi:lycopene beta-cyclase
VTSSNGQGGDGVSRIIIVGGGLSGCLAAMAIARRRSAVELLLLEQGETFGGNHTWSFFDPDVPAELRWVLDGIGSVRWPAHDVHFPRRSRTIPVGYNSIRSADLDRAVRAALRPDQYRLGANIQTLDPSSVLLEGKAIRANAVIDARGPAAMPGLDLAWQRFVGRYYRFSKPHGLNRPVIMDATVEQLDGYRFVYKLPVSPTEMLIEDTYYSATPVLDREAILDRIEVIAAKAGIGPREMVEEESGVLPIVLGGDIERLWEGERIPRLGLRGGFFHPTTSYSLPDAVANAALIAQQGELGSSSLHDLLHRRARRLWNDRSFFRLLNRMLFRAAEPDQAYRVLEHFYRLPPALIARFYAAHLSGFDKIRILSGKPPVPLGRALSTLLGTAA